jgi:hypothetical protein
MRKMYACGVDWQQEIGEAPDLEGKIPLYSSIQELMNKRSCWTECGIVEIQLSMNHWVVAQNLTAKPKAEEHRCCDNSYKCLRDNCVKCCYCGVELLGN